jgi:hypothetical protein
MSQPPFDLAKAHRWFAVEFNNRAWELVEQDSRTDEEVREMIDAAHAAAIHWRAVGTPINEQRAECLLTTAYLRTGDAAAALRHAKRGLQLSEQTAAGDEETPFDRAMTYASAARAHELLGQADEAKRLMQIAASAAGNLDPDDRRVFDALYS